MKQTIKTILALLVLLISSTGARAGLQLKHAFGTDATVKFWDGSTTEPVPSTFNTTLYPKDGAGITEIDNAGFTEDHYMIVYIVPKDGYWTDQQLLMATETGASLAPKRAPGFDPGRKLTLLKRDTYTDSEGTHDRHDGAGWYYYKLPKEHTTAAGYSASMVNGFVVEKFDIFNDSYNFVSQSADLKTVTISRTIDDWTVEITFDENKLIFPFDGTDKKPVITGITAKRGGIDAATVADNFDSYVVTGGQKFIGTQPVSLTASPNSWFRDLGFTGSANIIVEVPFTVEDNTTPPGSANNPWLITSTADMNLLAKCVNIGQFSFESMHIKLTKDLTYDATANADFLPVAVKGNGVVRWTDFAGTFDGDNHTISNLNYTHTISSPHKSRIGLFGQVTGTSDHPAAIKNLKLENCSFNGGAKDVIFGGTVAGALSYTNVSNITVTNCTVTAPLKENQPHVGGLVGDLGSGRITNCTVKGTSIACNTNEDGGSPDCARAGGIAGGNSDGEIDHCTVENCAISASYPATATKGNGVGGIIGYGYSANIHDNMVKGNTTITDVIGSADDSYVAAVIGDDGGDTGTPIYKNNYYEKSVTVSYKNSAMSEPIVLSGYTPRGYRQITVGTPTTIAFIDKTANDGAKMYVKPATISVTTTDGSTMAFDQTTVGTNVYSIEGTNNYYAPGDVITLTATYKQRVDDGRTFYDLPSVNVNNDDNIAITESNKTLAGNTYTSTYTFTMPDANATVNATITESDWFTMPTNGKKWMSLYHEWKQPTGAELQYTVTDYNDASPKTFTMKTISSVDAAKATVTSADIEDGVSYCGVPTLFNCDTNLPAVLKFTPYTGTVNKPTVAAQFKGTATAIAEGDLGNNIYVLNNAGEFILAYDKTAGLAAHRCYIDLGSAAAAPAILYIDGDVTGVKEVNASLEVKDDSFYTLGGRKLNGKPTAKGIYINNGKKVVIK